MQDSKRDVEIEQRIGKFVRDFSIAVQDEQSVNYNILRKMLRELLASEISKAREEGRKEKDIASDFLYWHPLGGGMPDSSIRIGVEFEVGGCHEDWGFVIEQNRRTISSGRTLKEAISKLTTK